MINCEYAKKGYVYIHDVQNDPEHFGKLDERSVTGSRSSGASLFYHILVHYTE